MDIVAIEESTFEKMKKSFQDFADEIKQECGIDQHNDKWLSNDQVCSLLQISKRSLQHYRDSGIISHSQICNKFYYKLSDVEDLIERSTKNSNNENT